MAPVPNEIIAATFKAWCNERKKRKRLILKKSVKPYIHNKRENIFLLFKLSLINEISDRKIIEENACSAVGD